MQSRLTAVRIFILFILLTMATGCCCFSRSLYQKEIVTEYKNDLVSATVNADKLFLTANMSSHYKNSYSAIDNNVPVKLECDISEVNKTSNRDVTSYFLSDRYYGRDTRFVKVLKENAVAGYTIKESNLVKCKFVGEFSNKNLPGNNLNILLVEELSDLSGSRIVKYKWDYGAAYILINTLENTINLTPIDVDLTERNEIFHVAKGVLYPITAILDIITFPLQLMTMHGRYGLSCPAWAGGPD